MNTFITSNCATECKHTAAKKSVTLVIYFIIATARLQAVFIARHEGTQIALSEFLERVVHIGEEGSCYGPLSNHFAANYSAPLTAKSS